MVVISISITVVAGNSLLRLTLSLIITVTAITRQIIAYRIYMGTIANILAPVAYTYIGKWLNVDYIFYMKKFHCTYPSYVTMIIAMAMVLNFTAKEN